MDDLPFPQELQRLPHIRVIHHAQQIVIGGAGLLLGCQILVQIGDGIAGGLEGEGAERLAGGCHRVDAHGMIGEIWGEAAVFDLFDRQIIRQLMDDGGYDLQVPQLLRAQRSIGNVPMHQI